MKITVGGTQLATILGIEERTVRRLRQRGVISPVNGHVPRPQYPALDSVRLYVDYRREFLARRSRPGRDKLNESKLRKVKSRIGLARQRLTRLETGLHFASDVEMLVGKINTLITNLLTDFPDRAAADLVGIRDMPAGADALEKAVNRLLLEIQAGILKFDEPGSPNASEAV